MSEFITHLAICDDTIRLAGVLPEVHRELVRVAQSKRDLMHMGAATRSADKWSASIVQWYADQQKLPAGERDQKADGKLAFVLGALTHRSADRLMKPIIRRWRTPTDNSLSRQATIHMDIFCFKEIYGGGSGEQAGRFPLDVITPPKGDAHVAMEGYFRVLWTRALMAQHTFSPDSGNMLPWLDRFIDLMQEFPIDLDLHARIWAEWKPENVKRFLTDQRFYERTDPLIAAARDLQNGRPVSPADAQSALAATTDQSSRYARALKKALEYWVAAGDLLNGRVDLEQCQRRFDVGVPELSLADQPMRDYGD